jgi:hypothetical protein
MKLAAGAHPAQFQRDHATKRSHLISRYQVPLMVRQSRIVNLDNGRKVDQPSREGGGVPVPQSKKFPSLHCSTAALDTSED